MDGQFLSAYNEVILDNFTAVLKQNFMFQTQLKFVEDQKQKLVEAEEKIAKLQDIGKKNEALMNEVDDLKGQLNSKDALIKSATNSDVERHRLQTAVNTQTKEIANLKESVGSLQKEIDSQKDYITQLEEMLPNSKKKKLGIAIVEEEKPVLEVKEEKQKPTPEIENVNILQFESSGGTF